MNHFQSCLVRLLKAGSRALGLILSLDFEVVVVSARLNTHIGLDHSCFDIFRILALLNHISSSSVDLGLLHVNTIMVWSHDEAHMAGNWRSVHSFWAGVLTPPVLDLCWKNS